MNMFKILFTSSIAPGLRRKISVTLFVAFLSLFSLALPIAAFFLEQLYRSSCFVGPTKSCFVRTAVSFSSDIQDRNQKFPSPVFQLLTRDAHADGRNLNNEQNVYVVVKRHMLPTLRTRKAVHAELCSQGSYVIQPSLRNRMERFSISEFLVKISADW